MMHMNKPFGLFFWHPQLLALMGSAITNPIGLIVWYPQLLILIGVGAAIGVAVVGVGVAVYVSGRRKKTKLLMMLQESTVDLGIDLVCLCILDFGC
jgi:hypothetical protein